MTRAETPSEGMVSYDQHLYLSTYPRTPRALFVASVNCHKTDALRYESSACIMTLTYICNWNFKHNTSTTQNTILQGRGVPNRTGCSEGACEYNRSKLLRMCLCVSACLATKISSRSTATSISRVISNAVSFFQIGGLESIIIVRRDTKDQPN